MDLRARLGESDSLNVDGRDKQDGKETETVEKANWCKNKAEEAVKEMDQPMGNLKKSKSDN